MIDAAFLAVAVLMLGPFVVIASALVAMIAHLDKIAKNSDAMATAFSTYIEMQNKFTVGAMDAMRRAVEVATSEALRTALGDKGRPRQ